MRNHDYDVCALTNLPSHKDAVVGWFTSKPFHSLGFGSEYGMEIGYDFDPSSRRIR